MKVVNVTDARWRMSLNLRPTPTMPRNGTSNQDLVWKTERPFRRGSRIVFAARFLGRELTYTYEVVKWQPGQRLVMRTEEGPFPMETTYVWEEIDPQTTRMTLRNRGYPSGFSSLMAPFMRLAMRKANGKDLHRLKALLEKA